MDSNFALYKQYKQVGVLGDIFPNPIQDGQQFNTVPFPVGQGNRCRFCLWQRPPGKPVQNATVFAIYFTWFGDNQRFITDKLSLLPTGDRFEEMEVLNVASAVPDTRIHELKYHVTQFPTTDPPIPTAGPAIGANFEWEIVAPMDSFIAHLITQPIGPFAGQVLLYAAPGSNAQ